MGNNISTCIKKLNIKQLNEIFSKKPKYNVDFTDIYLSGEIIKLYSDRSILFRTLISYDKKYFITKYVIINDLQTKSDEEINKIISNPLTIKISEDRGDVWIAKIFSNQKEKKIESIMMVENKEECKEENREDGEEISISYGNLKIIDNHI